MNNFWKEKMQYWWTALYCPFYLFFFFVIENLDRNYKIISIGLDHKIPFNEYFVIPYLLWFPYVIITYLIFFFKDKEEFLDFIKYLFMGMTLFIILSYLFPNGLDIRPTEFERDNIFVHMVQALYKGDTSTNVAPSIHAYNSIVIMIAAIKSKKVIVKNWQKVFCVILSIAIIISTVFIKQHSLMDIAGAVLLAAMGYYIYYVRHGSVVKQARKLIRQINY